MHQMVLYYSLGLFAVFEQVGEQEAAKMAEAASNFASECPLHNLAGSDKRFTIPHIGECTAGKTLALIPAFIVWKASILKMEYMPENKLIEAASTALELYHLDKERKEAKDGVKNNP